VAKGNFCGEGFLAQLGTPDTE